MTATPDATPTPAPVALRPGTLKDWTQRRSYKAVLRNKGEVVWTCEHEHGASHLALTCAFAEAALLEPSR